MGNAMPCIALSTFSRKLRHNSCVLLSLLSRSSLSVSIERWEVQFPSGSPKRGQMRRGSGCLWVECMLRETLEQGLPALSWMVKVMHTWKSSLKPLRKLTEQYRTYIETILYIFWFYAELRINLYVK